MLFVKRNIQYIPPALLLVISFFWSWYYLSDHQINGYGMYKQEWYLLLDGLIFLPLVCILCYWKNIKKAFIKALIYACLIVLLGSYIIPDEQKSIWLILENLRYVVVAVFVALEVTAGLAVIWAIRNALGNDTDPDNAISQYVYKVFGFNTVSSFICFEMRVWTYVLFANRIALNAYDGNQYFYGAKKDGTQSNLLGFIYLIIFELPLVHLLLYFLWSPMVAHIVTGLTIFGLIYFVAEYRAFALRPISLTDEGVIVRYALKKSVFIKYADIEFIRQGTFSVKRGNGVLICNYYGQPNVKIAIKERSASYDEMHFIYLGLDCPKEFLQRVNVHLQ